MNFSQWVWLAVALPLGGFLVNGALSLRRSTARGIVSVVGTGVLLGAFAVSLGVFVELFRVPPEAPIVVTLWPWLPVGGLQVDVAFQVDQLSAVMLLVVTGVGSVIHLFSIGYMKDDPGYARYFAYLNLFIVFMLVLVLGSSFPVMFIGWEGVGLCSYLLIGFWFNDKANADAGLKAFIMNRIGDVGFLVAMFFIWRAFGSLDFISVSARAASVLEPGGAIVTAITLFLFLGCTGKSAQIPLYTWLPDAMAGPTPVSALIHAATMVTAGVYLVARTNVLFAMAPVSSTVVAGIGALTALFAATIGLRQYDIKKVLAYSTVSQLGYMFLAVGTGAYVSGIFHLVTHAFFKALLFLGSGSVIHAMHQAYHATHSHEDAQDMRNMGGLRQVHAAHVLADDDRDARHRRDPAVLRLLLEGRDPRRQRSPAGRSSRSTTSSMAMGVAGGVAHRLLHGAPDGDDVHRRESHRRAGAGASARRALDHDRSARGAGRAEPRRRVCSTCPPSSAAGAGLEHWLEPVVAPAKQFFGLEMPHGSTEYLLVGAAVAIAILGLVAGFRATLRRPILPASEAPRDRGFALILNRKYYVDEIYDALIVHPLVWLSRVVLWKGVDQTLVDGVGVNGAARVGRGLGWLGSRLQTGQVGVYVIVFLVGALWVLRAMLR